MDVSSRVMTYARLASANHRNELAFASRGTTFMSPWNVVLQQPITDRNKTMNRALAVAFGGLVMLAAVAAYGQESN
jgi:hypothetical protein